MNQKLLSIAVSIAMAIGMAGLGSAADVDREDEEIVAVVDTPDGVEKLTQEDLDEIREQLEDHSFYDGCSGDAPVETYCETGQRSFVFLHGCLPGTFEGAVGYTGTIESRLVHDGADRTFACTYEDGSLVGTEGGGSFPSGDFVQEGYSYAPNTYGTDLSPLTDALDGNPTGAPGGVGHWAVVLI